MPSSTITNYSLVVTKVAVVATVVVASVVVGAGVVGRGWERRVLGTAGKTSHSDSPQQHT